MQVSKKVEELYGNKIRTRVCGVCFDGDAILLVKHHGLGKSGILWTPPGGGMQYGSSAGQNLIREFKEETGLDVAVERFLFVYEYIGQPLQTVELFFEVKITGGTLCRGYDPEMSPDDQIIDEVRFVSLAELAKFVPDTVHFMLQGLSKKEALIHKSGLFIFEKN